MPEIVPRYEFRAFAQQFGVIEARIRQDRICEQIRESVEFYLLPAQDNAPNTKIRDGKIDVKVLLGTSDGLEQWAPRLKTELPLSAAAVRDELFPGLGVDVPELARPAYTLTELVEEVIRPHPALAVAQVFKRRFGFQFGGCITEVAELLVNGAAIRTVAVESEDPGAARAALEALGLAGYENLNYVRALKRIVGVDPLPSGFGS